MTEDSSLVVFSRHYSHKTFKYGFCSCNQKTANQNMVYNISSDLIGWLWGTSTKLILEICMIVNPGTAAYSDNKTDHRNITEVLFRYIMQSSFTSKTLDQDLIIQCTISGTGHNQILIMWATLLVFGNNRLPWQW